MAKYTNKGLIAYARAMLEYHSPYWYSTVGQIASEALYEEEKRQNPSQYTKWSKSSFTSQYGMKVHDCSGLIKGYLMSPCIDGNGIVTDPLKPSVYNSKYDWSANMMIKDHCSETGSIDTIPEEEGLIVWKDGHVGIYDKNGYVIEERGHSYGTVRTRLADRPFVRWGRLSCIEYIKDDPQPSGYAMVDIQMPTLHQGDQCVEVSLLQILLNDLGFRDDSGSKLKIDGHYGQRTFEAVCRMQEAWNLGADGTVGVGTWNALLHHRYN